MTVSNAISSSCGIPAPSWEVCMCINAILCLHMKG
jgi:hypothetical protein